jgi:hypothetical protein
MIRTSDELMGRISAALKNMPEGSHEERLAWAAENEEVMRLRGLMDVYLDAYQNPPEGVIGVGAITYAEHKMQEAQRV